MKKYICALLSLCIAISVCTVSAHASSFTEDTNTESSVKESQSLIDQKFPEGIPEFLSEDEIQIVLSGQYFCKEVDGVIHHFNPESNPLAEPGAYHAGSRANEPTQWDEDLDKSHTWYPKYATLKYSPKFLIASMEASTKFFVGQLSPNVPYVNLAGNAWVQIYSQSGEEKSKIGSTLIDTDYRAYLYASAKVGGSTAQTINYGIRSKTSHVGYDTSSCLKPLGMHIIGK